MGWLANVFKSKELLYCEQMYATTLKDKEQLKTDNETLRIEVKELNKQLIELLTKQKLTVKTVNNSNTVNEENKTPGKLSPKEKKILNLIEKTHNFKEVLKGSKMKVGSLKVYLSRIRKKNYIFGLN